MYRLFNFSEINSYWDKGTYKELDKGPYIIELISSYYYISILVSFNNSFYRFFSNWTLLSMFIIFFTKSSIYSFIFLVFINSLF